MASGGVRVKVTDRGAEAMLKRLIAARAPRGVAVGVLAKDAQTGAAESPGLTVLDVAIFNEFGTKNADGTVRIPERSFIRAWADSNAKEAADLLRRLVAQSIKGKITEDQALNRFGLWAQGQIQLRIANGIPPPNAQSTIDRKGSDKPLIDTGQLRSSISYEIRK